MDLIFIILAIVVVLAFFTYLSNSKEQAIKNSTNNIDYEENLARDFYRNRQYKLMVLPTVFTSLKALKLRGKVFNSQEEINKINLKQNEAHAAVYMPEYDDQRILNKWTDGGTVSNEKELEAYYKFLEEVRYIFEDKTLSATDRFDKLISLCKLNEQYRTYFNNLNEYYKAFPSCLFIKDLTKVNGVGDGIAFTLFNSGIKTLKELRELSDEELNEIPGVGRKTIQQIRAYFKNKIELER